MMKPQTLNHQIIQIEKTKKKQKKVFVATVNGKSEKEIEQEEQK